MLACTFASLILFVTANGEVFGSEDLVSAAARYRSRGSSRSYSSRSSSSSSSSDWDDESSLITWVVVLSIVGFFSFMITSCSMCRRLSVARGRTLCLTAFSWLTGCGCVLVAGNMIREAMLASEEAFTASTIALSVVGAFIWLVTPYLFLHYVKRKDNDDSSHSFTFLTGEVVRLNVEDESGLSEWHNALARVTNSNMKNETYDVCLIQRGNADDVMITGLSLDNLILDEMRNRGT